MPILRLLSQEWKGIRDVCSLERVCRAMRDLVQQFWNGITELGHRELFVIGAPPNRVVRWLSGMTARCRDLRKLDLSWCRDTNYPLTDRCLVDLVSRCPNLESINLRWSR
eukprot:2542852-Pyramimonas_sp.AAC.1